MPALIALSGILVGAESRFFLQALVCREQDILTVPFKLKPVAKLLCLTERLVREASLELVEAGLLVALKQSGKVGRPGVEYEASQSLRDLLAEPEKSTYFHQDLVLHIFSEPDIRAKSSQLEADEGNDKAARKQIRQDGRPAAPGAQGRLGASTRILLAALLASADQCGVVTGVGEAKLLAMTGLSSHALTHQVKRLVGLGFILVHVSGVSNGIFVGAKVTSIYYLDLRHPQLGNQNSRDIQWTLLSDGQGYNRLTKGLPKDAKKALLALGPAVLNVLYHKLAGYISHLLSLTLGESDEKHSDAHESIAGMIDQELGTLKLDNLAQGEVSKMSTHFWMLTLEWSRILRKMVGDSPNRLIRLMPTKDIGGNGRELILQVLSVPAGQNQRADLGVPSSGKVDLLAK